MSGERAVMRERWRRAAEAGDRYAIERELGRGAVATVYLATDRKHDRAVALKVLRPEIAGGADAKRFVREIGLLARLHHPHILPLYDSGTLALARTGGWGLFYVMPYIRGEIAPPAARAGGAAADRGRGAHRARGGRCAGIRARRKVSCTATSGRRTSCWRAGHALVADFGIARALEAAGESGFQPRESSSGFRPT